MSLAARRWVRGSVVAAGLCHALALAQAQPTGDAGVPTETASPPVAERERAREHFQRGVGLIEVERWADAIDELQAARQIRSTPAVLYNLGLAYRAVGRNREAMETFREFNRAPSAASSPELALRVQSYIRELAQGLGTLDLQVEPLTARVRVDGNVVVRRGLPVEVDPGPHVVVAEAQGFTAETRTVEVRRGASATVSMRLAPLVMASRVTVVASPSSALVRLDGRDVGYGNVEETVRPGPHTLDVSADGYAPFHRQFDAVVGQPLTVRASLNGSRSVLSSPWLWLGVSVVAAGAGVAAWFLLQDVAPPYRGSLGTVTDAFTLGGAR